MTLYGQSIGRYFSALVSIIMLKEPSKCWRCGKQLQTGMPAKRQMFKDRVRYYHVDCHVRQFYGHGHK